MATSLPCSNTVLRVICHTCNNLPVSGLINSYSKAIGRNLLAFFCCCSQLCIPECCSTVLYWILFFTGLPKNLWILVGPPLWTRIKLSLNNAPLVHALAHVPYKQHTYILNSRDQHEKHGVQLLRSSITRLTI